MTRTDYLPVRISPEERSIVQSIADDRCTSVSAVIRWAIHTVARQEAQRIASVGMKKGSAAVVETGGAALAVTNQ